MKIDDRYYIDNGHTNSFKDWKYRILVSHIVKKTFNGTNENILRISKCCISEIKNKNSSCRRNKINSNSSSSSGSGSGSS